MATPPPPNKTIYLSYSKKDKELVSELVSDLAKNGLNTWFDENQIEHGKEWQSKIRKGLKQVDAVLVIITPDSISSNYVMNELGIAKEMGKLIIPVIRGEVAIPVFIKDIQVIYWRDNYEDVVVSIVKALSKIKPPEAETPKVQDKIDLDAIDSSTRPKKSAQKKAARNYWFFKMNASTWEIENLKVHELTYFNTHFFKKKRPEYDLFSEINIGDHVLGFATGSYQAVFCLMEVTDAVGPNTEQGEGFNMIIKRILKPMVATTKLAGILPQLLPKLTQNKKPPELLYRITEADYNAVMAVADKPGGAYENVFQPFYVTEGDHRKTDDQLDFENDINSFATVIALKKVDPPLAIGLFGNWGSGKSFFMEKLSERIEDIIDLKEEDYIKDVVQVKFNSWHYSDANLWASLITQIFESLHDYATKKQFGAEAIKAIYKDLNITSQQLEETQKKIDANAVQASALQEQKAKVEETIQQKKDKLKIWTAGDLVKIVFSDSFIQDDFEKIKSQFKNEKLIDNINEIDEKLATVDTGIGQVVQSFKLLKNNRKGNWIGIWILAILFAVIFWLAMGPLKEYIKEFVSGVSIATSLFVVWLTNLMVKLRPYFNIVTSFYKRLKNLKQTIDTEKEKVKLKEHDEVARLNKDIIELTAEKAALEVEQTQTQEKKAKLENEIKEIGSGKLLATFLAGKSADDAYIKQLGIISWVRKDFAKLNELFQKQRSVQAAEKDLRAEFQIDRIVLYIDDLDRCNEDVVVKVLEAIHLLLAFPLFVVIVGVDPRWLNNALSEKYKNLFGYEDEKRRRKDGVALQQSDDVNTVLDGVATSYDYLEKIFQIPFALKPINKTGREKLIKYLIKDEMVGGNVYNAEVVETANAQDIPTATTEPLLKDAGKKIMPDPHIETEEEKLQKAKKMKERLVFTKQELEYMQKISSLFGQTPRAINRYVNIYRIIKAHGNLKVVGEFSKEEFMPIMFILGIIVGFSVFAEEFIGEISGADDTDQFKYFMDKSSLDEKLKELIKPLAVDIENLAMDNFKRNLELISRFSFRTLLK